MLEPRAGFPSSNMTTQKCILCRESFTPDKNDIIYGALIFTAEGRYGSAYDPVSVRRFLSVTICDVCVAAKARDGLVNEVSRTPVPDKLSYEFYDPDATDLQ